MPWLVPLLTTLALSTIGAFLPTWGFLLIVVASAAGAAYDSVSLELERYESGIRVGPSTLFLTIAVLWIIGFPWYLYVRGRIKAGTARLRIAGQ